jgi:hypothetical protein
VTPAPKVDGRSIVPLLENPSARWVDETLVEFVGVSTPEWWGIRTARFAYTEYPSTGEVELYDLVADPHELVNRCSGTPPACDPAHARVRRRLAARLVALRSE